MATAPVKPPPRRPGASSAASSGGAQRETPRGMGTPEKPRAQEAKVPLTPQRPPLFKITPYDATPRWLRMLVYGAHGAGKTYLAGTSCLVPTMNDVLLVSAESGELTLQDFEVRPDVVPITSYQQFGAVADFLSRHCKARDADDKEALKRLQARFTGVPEEKIPDNEVRTYRTLIVDSLSEIEEYCMYQLLGIKETTRPDEEVDTAEWTEYRKLNAMVKRAVRNLRDLPMHTIFICAEQYTQDDTKKMMFMPQMTGKLARQIQGFMDVVGYITVAQGTQTIEGKPQEVNVRRLFVQPSSSKRYAAKCRFARFQQPYMDNPSVGGLLKAVGIPDSK